MGSRTNSWRSIDAGSIYDRGAGRTPGAGGTTTLIYDPRDGRTLHKHLSLAGTEINCAGGATPWRTWLSCEECFEQPGSSTERNTRIERERRHGYVFEVPVDSRVITEPAPLKAMGRFEHEAAAVDPRSGVVYLSEDRVRSLLYRYVPDAAGQLARGGRLEALRILGQPGFDTRNWAESNNMPLRQWFTAAWIELDNVDSDENDLRLRGHARGAALFGRGEGLCFAEDSLFMTATIGGPGRLGQVFEYRATGDEGQLRLIAEADRDGLLHNADNLTMSPWGDLIVCEDTAVNCGLVGLSPDGKQYPLANHPYSTAELAGVCFSPDGRTLFVNVQQRGLILAIDGGWPSA